MMITTEHGASNLIETTKEGLYLYEIPEYYRFCESPSTKKQRVSKKIKRNSICECGSGKKYKKCCGRY